MCTDDKEWSPRGGESEFSVWNRCTAAQYRCECDGRGEGSQVPTRLVGALFRRKLCSPLKPSRVPDDSIVPDACLPPEAAKGHPHSATSCRDTPLALSPATVGSTLWWPSGAQVSLLIQCLGPDLGPFML